MPVLFMMSLACLRVYQLQPLLPKTEKMLYIIPSSVGNVSIFTANFSTLSANNYQPKEGVDTPVSRACLLPSLSASQKDAHAFVLLLNPA